MEKSKHIKWNNLTIPLIQGGMGVGISLGGLAGSVCKLGGMGVISAAHPGYRKENFLKNVNQCNHDAMLEEVEKARTISEGKGLLAVNIMCAIQQFEASVKTALEANVDAIICGAGLPLSLPTLTSGHDVLLAPIVSSGKAAELLLRSWDKRNQCTADFVVVEGPLAGGHLGFKPADLYANTTQSIEEIFLEVKPIVAEYEEKYNKQIPIYVAGGLNTYEKVKQMMDLGADGVQVATSFIPTIECDADIKFKNEYLNHDKKELSFILSPVGYLGRCLTNPMSTNAANHRIPPNYCVNCIKSCVFKTTPFCISETLIEAAKGNVVDGLLFSGDHLPPMDHLVSVEEVIKRLLGDII